MTICTGYDHMYQIWPSVQDMTICTRYHHLYRIWPSVQDMTICTRYEYLSDMTICTGYDHMYQIWPSVPDITICTRYDYPYRIRLRFKFIAWILITPIRWSRITFNDICDILLLRTNTFLYTFTVVNVFFFLWTYLCFHGHYFVDLLFFLIRPLAA